MSLRIVAFTMNKIWTEFRSGSKILRSFIFIKPVVEQPSYRSTDGMRLEFQTVKNLAPLKVAQNIPGRESVKLTNWGKSENCKAKANSPKDAADETSLRRLMNNG